MANGGMRFYQPPAAAPGGGGGFNLGEAQMMANMLATPARIQASHQQAAIDRALLGRMGIPEAEARALVPEPPFQLPGGIAGKALSGLGTAGSLMSTILGAPIAAPRARLTDVMSAQYLGASTGKAQAAEKAAQIAGQYVQTPDDTEVKTALVQELFRAGLGGSAVSLMKPQTGLASLSKLIAREAERHIGRPIGDPDTDLYALNLHMMVAAGVQAAKDQAKEDVKWKPENVERRVRSEYLKRFMTAKAGKEGEQAVAMARLKDLLPTVKEAVENDFWADSYTSRLAQWGKFRLALGNPKWASRLSEGIDQEFINRAEAVQALKAFAGLFLRAPGIDTGRLSDPDIERVTEALVRISDTKMTAKAKLAVWDRLFASAVANGPGSDIEVMAQEILDLDNDGLVDLPGGIKVGAGGGKLDLKANIPGKIPWNFPRYSAGEPQERPALPTLNPEPNPRQQEVDKLLDLLEGR